VREKGIVLNMSDEDLCINPSVLLLLFDDGGEHHYHTCRVRL